MGRNWFGESYRIMLSIIQSRILILDYEVLVLICLVNTGGGWVIETFKFFVNVNLVMACILVVTVGKDKQEGG